MTANAQAQCYALRRARRYAMLGGTGLVLFAAFPMVTQSQVADSADIRAVLNRFRSDTLRRQRIEGIVAADSLRRDSVFKRVDRVMVQLGRLPWMIPEAHDEQPLTDGAGNYGPMSYIFASPYLDGFTREAQFIEHGPRGVLVAVVYVNAPVNAVLPATYGRLQLRGGVNCIWLSAAPAANLIAWAAYVSSAQPSDSTCVAPPAPGPFLVVRRTGAPGHFDVPPVARFDEDVAGQPLLGVKCLAGWCEIGPQGFQRKVALVPEVPPGHRETRIKGWHDEQRLAVDAGAGQMTPGPRAALRPVRNLHALSAASFRMTWRPVATIFFLTTPPPGSNYAKWGLQAGHNRLELIEFEGRWVARIRRQDGSIRYWPHVQRHVHYDAPVPGAARFRWTALDDGGWVPCGQACCLVDGM